jgi:hypothetical protein
MWHVLHPAEISLYYAIMLKTRKGGGGGCFELGFGGLVCGVWCVGLGSYGPPKKVYVCVCVCVGGGQIRPNKQNYLSLGRWAYFTLDQGQGQGRL